MTWSNTLKLKVATALGLEGFIYAAEMEANVPIPAIGVGGSVTQLTNRTTGVTLNTSMGWITTNNAALLPETAADFTLTNSLIAIGDTVICTIIDGSNGATTQVFCAGTANGSATIRVLNNNPAGGANETGAIRFSFSVSKVVST